LGGVRGGGPGPAPRPKGCDSREVPWFQSGAPSLREPGVCHLVPECGAPRPKGDQGPRWYQSGAPSLRGPRFVRVRRTDRDLNPGMRGALPHFKWGAFNQTQPPVQAQTSSQERERGTPDKAVRFPWSLPSLGWIQGTQLLRRAPPLSRWDPTFGPAATEGRKGLRAPSRSDPRACPLGDEVPPGSSPKGA
jgi:hypothetical protein